MKDVAKFVVAVVLYLPALAFDLLMFAWVDVLNALFWGFIVGLVSFEAGLFAFALALVIGTHWETFQTPTTKLLEKWAGA